MAQWRFDLHDAERRRHEAAEEAKRLEDAGHGLAHLALLKRLADRPRDREDLAALEAAYGSLPDPPQP